MLAEAESKGRDVGLANHEGRGVAWRRQSDAALAAVLVLAVLVCFANMLLNGFVYDDGQQILDNPYVKSWKFLPEIFTTTVWSFVGQAGTTNYYRPLMTVSFLVLWKIFGPIPFGFHLFSLLVHAGVVLAMFYAGMNVFNDRRVAWVAALLFAVHPIHTEAVDWIAAFPDLEAAFFLLLAFWWLSKPGRIDWKRQLLILGAFALALLAKEPSLMLAPLAIALEHGAASNAPGRTFQEKLRHYAPVCALGTLYLLMRIALFGKLAPVLQHPQVSWTEAIYSAFALVEEYVRLLIWPTKLSAFHVFHVSRGIAEPGVLAGLGIAVAYLAGIVLLWKRQPRVAFSLVWIGLLLAPVLNARWMAANVLTERYLYLPSVGFCWLVGYGGVKVWDMTGKDFASARVRRALIGSAFAAVVLVAAATAVARNRDWANDLTLYTRTLEVNPDAHIIRSNRAGVYFESGQLELAEREWKWALAGKPDNVVTMNALGVLYNKEGRYAEATAILQQAIALKPLWGDARYNYGITLQSEGRREEAIAEFQRAIELAPVNPSARLWYGKALIQYGDYREAEVQLKRAVELQPSHGALEGLAQVYLATGQDALAEATLRRMLDEDKYDGEAHLKLARLLERSGRSGQAREQYEAVLVTDPENEEAKAALGRLQKK